MNLRETYNKIARDWQKQNAGVTWSTAYVHHFAHYFEPGARILDVGCGPGNKAKELIEDGLRVHGIDLSEEMIKVAREIAPTATFEVMDIQHLDALQETYDGIMGVAVLLHLKKADVPAVVKSLWNKLNPSGYCYMAVKELKGDEPDEKVVVNNDLGYEYERFFSHFTMAELKGYLMSLGTMDFL